MTKTTTPADAPSADAFERFLALLVEQGHMRRSADAVGLTLEQIARRERTDDEFKERLKDARAARRYLIADALLEEGVLGRESVDAVNGKVTRTRNIAVLTALARKEQELDAERPATAVQVNTNVASTPQLLAAQLLSDITKERERRRLAKQSAAGSVIDVEVLPAPTTDEDLL